jgi:hypothetical protein
MFIPLNFPRAPLKLVRKNGQVFVFCTVRKKNLLLTPEEWVRQHAIHFLIQEKQVPFGLIASEFAVKVNQLNRRCDVVVFGPDGTPKLVVECKAPDVKLTENVLYQIAQYNFSIQADFLMITNGLEHFYCRIDRARNTFEFMETLRSWEEMTIS